MNLPHTGTLQRPYYGKDDEGAATPVQWETVADNVACFVQPDNATESIQFHRLEGLMPYKVYVDSDLGVRVKDRFVCTSNEFNGKTLNVLGQRSFGLVGFWRIECEEDPSGQHLQG